MPKKQKPKLKDHKPHPLRPRRGRPRSQVLPGMEAVRDQRLDHLCEAIADERAIANKARQEEAGLVVAALDRMHERAITVYRHGGIELTRVPGLERLRVRFVKATGDAEVNTGATTPELEPEPA